MEQVKIITRISITVSEKEGSIVLAVKGEALKGYTDYTFALSRFLAAEAEGFTDKYGAEEG